MLILLFLTSFEDDLRKISKRKLWIGPILTIFGSSKRRNEIPKYYYIQKFPTHGDEHYIVDRNAGSFTKNHSVKIHCFISVYIKYPDQT